MKQKTVVFTLERAARKSGGDRYKAEDFEGDFSIYIPQSISRPEGKPVDALAITFSVEDK